MKKKRSTLDNKIKSPRFGDDVKKDLKNLYKNANSLYELRNEIVNTIEYSRKSSTVSDDSWLSIDKKEKQEQFVKKVEILKKNTKNDEFLKYIVENSFSLINVILSEKIDSRKEAAENFLKIYRRNDAKKLRNTSTRSNSNHAVKSILIDLEYKIFDDNGLEDKRKDLELIPDKSEEQIISEEIKKFDTATVGKDDEEAPKDAKTIGSGLKIMAPKQMIIRLPILLAQLKVGSNSNKLKNEIRQIVYSLCRSKNLSKTIYKHLLDNI